MAVQFTMLVDGVPYFDPDGSDVHNAKNVTNSLATQILMVLGLPTVPLVPGQSPVRDENATPPIDLYQKWLDYIDGTNTPVGVTPYALLNSNQQLIVEKVRATLALGYRFHLTLDWRAPGT